ncbi:MAG: hypothetical protein V2I43_25485 [Parvularcula sp.]|jgi:hypothetical protein|nr:hypothetical protein [Parvularcula sp.]
MRRVFQLVGGCLLIVLGTVLTISPLPFGFVLVFWGFGLVVMASPRAAAWLRFNRTYNDTLNKHAAMAAKHLPQAIAEAVKKTDPHRSYQ